MGKAAIDWTASVGEVIAGRIPLHARARLQEVAGPGRQLFTSDLSVNEFLLSQDAQCTPITQVMGCSIFHVGKIPDYKGATGVLKTITHGHKESRRLAISRLQQEARLVDADAVIGVRIEDRLITTGERGKGGDDGDEIIEFTVIGTAVKAPWLTKRGGKPVLTDLSGQDIWALYSEGFEPTGLIFDFCRYHVWHVLNGWSGGAVTEADAAVAAARDIVTREVRASARDHGAEFVVGDDIRVRTKEVPCGYEGCHLNDLDVDFSWFATGVARRPPGSVPRQTDIPPLILGMMPLGRRRKDELLDDEDDAESVEKAAEKLEERAAESDEGGE